MNYLIKHSTKGYFAVNNWIVRDENTQHATKFKTIDEAISKAKTLSSSDGTLLKTLQIGIVHFNGNPFGFRSFNLVATVNNIEKNITSHTSEQFTY
jgi:hypothetical protein